MQTLQIRPETAVRLSDFARRAGQDETVVAHDAIEAYLDELEAQAARCELSPGAEEEEHGSQSVGDELFERLERFHRRHPNLTMDDAGAFVSAMRDEDQH